MPMRKWIQNATAKHKGALHSEMGIPEHKQIPGSLLEKWSKKPGKAGQRARLAETLRKFAKSGKGKKKRT